MSKFVYADAVPITQAVERGHQSQGPLGAFGEIIDASIVGASN